MERLVQLHHARKRDPALGGLDEQAPEHLHPVGDAGVHDGVVDVADDDVTRRGGRNVDERLVLGPIIAPHDFESDGVPALRVFRPPGPGVAVWGAGTP